MENIKIARVVTVPEAFVHIQALLTFLRRKNIQINLVSSSGTYEKILEQNQNLKINKIEIKREINFWADLRALISLIIFFRKNNFDIIHSSTPKAGLLVALAGIFSPHSVRIHTFTGQRWATESGIFKLLLKFLDKVVISFNHQCYADSVSQIEFLKREGIAKDREVLCLHKGSYGGVDCKRFDRSRFPNFRQELAKELNIPIDHILIFFIGRITKQKGVEELVQAFSNLYNKNSKTKLILIGPYEKDLDPLHKKITQIIDTHPAIFSLGFRSDVEKYLSAADVLCLPSYREGFGTVVIEAAACGVPTIGTRIPGLVDAIVDGETGILVDLKSTDQLERALLDLLNNPEKRIKLGQQALSRARSDFDSEKLAEIQWEEYLRLLKKNSE